MPVVRDESILIEEDQSEQLVGYSSSPKAQKGEGTETNREVPIVNEKLMPKGEGMSIVDAIINKLLGAATGGNLEPLVACVEIVAPSEENLYQKPFQLMRNLQQLQKEIWKLLQLIW